MAPGATPPDQVAPADQAPSLAAEMTGISLARVGSSSRATLARALTAARSEVRAAREAVASAGRGLDRARAAADLAQQVVDIVNISFRAGAATNIEVIDAEGRARDADTAVGSAVWAFAIAGVGYAHRLAL